MNPYSRMAWTLGAALLIWSPVGYLVLTNRMEMTTGFLYLAGALVLAWIGTGALSSLISNYQQQAYRIMLTKHRIEMIERNAAEKQRRRKEDKEREEKEKAEG